jgi:hypothetical protein
MADPDVYYFGAWGAAGHYLWTPDGGMALEEQRRLPWKAIDGPLAGDPALADPGRPSHWSTDNQPEGIVRVHHAAGWTAIAFWDRSCDTRHGSNSALIAAGEHSAREMVELFQRTFPAVWERITWRFQLVLPVEAPVGGARRADG